MRLADHSSAVLRHLAVRDDIICRRDQTFARVCRVTRTGARRGARTDCEGGCEDGCEGGCEDGCEDGCNKMPFGVYAFSRWAGGGKRAKREKVTDFAQRRAKDLLLTYDAGWCWIGFVDKTTEAGPASQLRNPCGPMLKSSVGSAQKRPR